LRVFATRWFARFARKESIDEERLCAAIARAEKGSVDADLGGNLIKQRVARPGAGRSGGYRTVIAYHSAQRAVFLYGFAKSERENVGPGELADLKELARQFLGMSDAEIAKVLHANGLKELPYDDQEEEH
jgi:hypothetical protein